MNRIPDEKKRYLRIIAISLSLILGLTVPSACANAWEAAAHDGGLPDEDIHIGLELLDDEIYLDFDNSSHPSTELDQVLGEGDQVTCETATRENSKLPEDKIHIDCDHVSLPFTESDQQTEETAAFEDGEENSGLPDNGVQTDLEYADLSSEGMDLDPLQISEEGMALEDEELADIAVYYVSTGKELYELLYEDRGGVIYATENLVWDEIEKGYEYFLNVKEPVTVDMGPFTLFISCNTILWGSVHLKGDGTVVHVDDAYLQTDENVSISATGDGATAVLLEGDAGFNPGEASITVKGRNSVGIKAVGDSYYYFILDAIVTVQGAGSIAVDTEADLLLYRSIIKASGAGSVGVRSGGWLQLRVCEVAADGIGAHAGGSIDLDCSYVVPEPDDYTFSSRTAIIDPVNFYAEIGEPLEISDVMRAKLYLDPKNTRENPEIMFVPVIWDLEQVDQTMPGAYPITASIQSEFAARWPVVDWPVISGTVYIVYEGVIFVYETSGWAGTVNLHLYEPLWPDDIVTFSYRERGAEDWIVVEDSLVIVGESQVTTKFAREHIGKTYVFRLSVLRDGETLLSNEVTYQLRNQGGDRDGDDRDPDSDERPKTKGTSGRGNLGTEEETANNLLPDNPDSNLPEEMEHESTGPEHFEAGSIEQATKGLEVPTSDPEREESGDSPIGLHPINNSGTWMIPKTVFTPYVYGSSGSNTDSQEPMYVEPGQDQGIEDKPDIADMRPVSTDEKSSAASGRRHWGLGSGVVLVLGFTVYLTLIRRFRRRG